jgi:hypothetical protein
MAEECRRRVREGADAVLYMLWKRDNAGVYLLEISTVLLLPET